MTTKTHARYDQPQRAAALTHATTDVDIAIADEHQRWLMESRADREVAVEEFADALRIEDARLAALDDEAITNRVDPRWRKPNYYDYLASPEWRLRAQRCKRRNQCILCGRPGRLEAHHVTYNNLGRETRRDLVPLCSSCHARHHNAIRHGDRRVGQR